MYDALKMSYILNQKIPYRNPGILGHTHTQTLYAVSGGTLLYVYGSQYSLTYKSRNILYKTRRLKGKINVEDAIYIINIEIDAYNKKIYFRYINKYKRNGLGQNTIIWDLIRVHCLHEYIIITGCNLTS